MNNNPLNSFLMVALGALVAASLLFCYQTTRQTSELRRIAIEVNQLNQARGRMQVIVGTCMEYAKTNASLDSILEAHGLNPKAARAAKPGNK